MGSSRHPKAWIEHLPPELLGLIFSFMHEDYKRTTKTFEEGLGRPEINVSDDYHGGVDTEVASFLTEQNIQVLNSKSPFLFPYNVVAVCDTWKNVLSSSPAFWTHLVLFVDFPATPIAEARKYLQWSRQLPIDIFLLRGPDSHAEDVKHHVLEGQRVNAFIGLLQPHMNRCRSLHIDAMANTSIPYLSELVPNNAERLQSLYLSCQFDLASPNEEDEEQTDVASRDLPRLRTMSLDGHSFLRACARPPPWFRYQPQLRHRGISKFNGPSSALSLEETLDVINARFDFILSSLAFSDLKFKVDTDDVEADHYEFEQVQQLTLEGIHPEAVTEFFRVCSFPSLIIVHIQSCPGLHKGIFDNLDPFVRALALSRPMASDSEIIDFLSPWMGRALYLSLSQRPYDHVPNALCESADDIVFCPNLEILCFLMCPVQSFASIKKMIEHRNRNVNYEDPDWRVNTPFGPAIGSVEINNCWSTLDSLMWTQEEKDWLSERVVDFNWTVADLFPGFR